MTADTTDAMPTHASFKELVARAAQGDKAALGGLRSFLDGHAEVWQEVGRLAIESEVIQVNRIAGKDPLIEEAVLRTLKQLRSDLGSASATPLERIAIERVVATWLNLQLADKTMAASGGTALPGARYLLKRQDTAHRHFEAAMKSLQEIRRMLPKGKQDPTVSVADVGPKLQVFSGDEVETVSRDASRATGTA